MLLGLSLLGSELKLVCIKRIELITRKLAPPDPFTAPAFGILTLG